jgi:hypothetical protein
MMLKTCCDQWLQTLKPKIPRSGDFTEIHSCPTCGQKFRVTFEEIPALGDDGISDYAVVGADPV